MTSFDPANIIELFSQGIQLRKQLKGNADDLRAAFNRFNESGMNVAMVKLSADALAVSAAESLSLLEGSGSALSKKERDQMTQAACQTLRDALTEYARRSDEIRKDRGNDVSEA